MKSAGRRAGRRRPLGLLALLALAACGPADEGCVRVVSWAGYRELEIDEAIIDAFEARHPEIPVCYESLEGAGIYREKVLTSIAAGTPPDVFMLDGEDIPVFVEQGVVLNLLPFVGRVGVELSDYEPGVLDLFMGGDTALWAFPKDYTPMVIYYNEVLFDRAGVPYPRPGWTWAEFLDAARRLTRDTDGDGEIDQWGFGWPREFFYLLGWIWAGGGRVLSPDATRATGYLDSPETIAAVEFYLDLAREHGVAPRIEMFRQGFGGVTRLFHGGQVAMMQSGHWAQPEFVPREEPGRFEFGVAPLPTRAGVEPVTPVYAAGWAVPASAPHRKWSVQLAAFLASPTAQRIRARSGLAVAASPSVAEAIAQRDTTGRERVFLDVAATARHSPGTRVQAWREIQDVMFDLLDRPLVRQEPVGDVARDLARRVDAILARERGR